MAQSAGVSMVCSGTPTTFELPLLGVLVLKGDCWFCVTGREQKIQFLVAHALLEQVVLAPVTLNL